MSNNATPEEAPSIEKQTGIISQVYIKQKKDEKIGVTFRTHENGQVVVISNVKPYSPFCGKLFPNQRVVSINETPCNNHHAAVEHIREIVGAMEIKVITPPGQSLMQQFFQLLGEDGWEEVEVLPSTTALPEIHVWRKVFCKRIRPGSTHYFVFVADFGDERGLKREQVDAFSNVAKRIARAQVGCRWYDIFFPTGPAIAKIPIMITGKSVSQATTLYCESLAHTAPGDWGRPMVIETVHQNVYLGKRWPDVGETRILNMLGSLSFMLAKSKPTKA